MRRCDSVSGVPAAGARPASEFSAAAMTDAYEQAYGIR